MKNNIIFILIILILIVILGIMFWFYFSSSNTNFIPMSQTSGNPPEEMPEEKASSDVEANVSLVDESTLEESVRITYIELGNSASIVEGTGATVNDNIVTITQEGTYIFHGTLSNGQIIVDAPNYVVTIILNGTNISNSNGPAILSLTSIRTKITLADGTTNTLVDGGSNEEYDATIFSLVPLVIDGTGTLKATGTYQEAISSDSTLCINNGTLIITSKDDGLNSGEGIVINNGSIYIEASGDGIDSNADLIINGGTVVSYAANIPGDGGIDVDSAFVINGGTVIATGASLKTPSTKSTQASIILNYTTSQSANTLVHFENSGTDLITFKTSKEYQSLFYSSPELAEQETYQIYYGGSTTGILNNGIYSTGAYTKGTKMTSESSDFTITGIVNSFKNVQ